MLKKTMINTFKEFINESKKSNHIKYSGWPFPVSQEEDDNSGIDHWYFPEADVRIKFAEGKVTNKGVDISVTYTNGDVLDFKTEGKYPKKIKINGKTYSKSWIYRFDSSVIELCNEIYISWLEENEKK